jgi:hypothetical protein
MKNTIYSILFIVTLITLTACNKKDSSKETDTSLTIENLSGTYGLKALIWKSGSVSVNVYDQLDDCEKDNLIKLNPDKTANLIDAGTACSPPEDDNGTWDLKGDSLFISSTGIASKIKSYDGKILVLTGAPPNDPTVEATTTLEKK